MTAPTAVLVAVAVAVVVVVAEVVVVVVAVAVVQCAGKRGPICDQERAIHLANRGRLCFFVGGGVSTPITCHFMKHCFSVFALLRFIVKEYVNIFLSASLSVRCCIRIDSVQRCPSFRHMADKKSTACPD